MKFTDTLKEAAQNSWDQSLNHPFVQGIVKGDLPLDTFKNYILQDIYYLKHYGKIHAFAAAQADDFEVTAMLAETAKNTAQAELTVHNEHAKILNITDEEMKNFRPAPSAYGYTSHLYRTAISGSLGQIIAAMLPCYWLYADIGWQNRNAKPEQEIYQKWIATYASDWFQESTQKQMDLLNKIAETASEEEKVKMRDAFVYAKEYELMFWEMSYTFETWLSERNR